MMVAGLAARAVRAVATAKRAQGLADSVVQSLGSWRDPAAKLRRRRQRARIALYLRVVGAAVAGVLTGIAFADGDMLIGVFIGLFTAALIYAVVQSGLVVWHLQRTPMPVAPPALPPAGSGARKPMETLAARERTLGELLILLGPAAGDTAAEARSAATVLRGCADRIVTLESARRDAPADAAPDLRQALEVADEQLDGGVHAYERLVSAAAKAVSAASGNPAAALADTRLRDAADALNGFAAGMREIDTH
ncbi:MAG TPA: hypothetical protein VHX59_01770 [Mycobacteriales bacterium]|jgi:hypothetical protein|nr:hypothetical protein [Mycobacteriales bacterium]